MSLVPEDVKDEVEDVEVPGEYEVFIEPTYPREIDIDDGIERDIIIRQELFGVIRQYGNEFDVMRFSLSNKGKDAITVQVMSLGAALTGIICPDRNGVYRDVVLGFDDPQSYYSSTNPGFGRITSLCPLPYNLEKIVWDWDFDRDEGSVTFSTTFYKIDTVLTVRYMLTTCNEIVVDMKAYGSKILPISLTNQVYWNMAGHYKGEAALKHHALAINSDRIWKHHGYKLKNFIGVSGTRLDFRIPRLMDDTKVFGEANFEHVFVLTKGSEQRVAFAGRLIHPRSCRYVEIFSDQPWVLCNTFNKMPRAYPPGWDDLDICSSSEGADNDDDDLSTCSTDEDDAAEGNDNFRGFSKISFPYMDELNGKEGAAYQKYGALCMTPLSDLTGFDPMLRSSKPYSHRIIYKVGVYRKFMRPKPPLEEEGENELLFEDVQDFIHE
ncbi:UNVERIFIED_CONTAM: hypothetical protein PYX00_002798 [Menopon gallinae]|uniref:Galactose mutarotase n=1 Tax=Menopon gallinae TaxID=328185 RepID=A0AAW2HYV4_9NEOP